MMLEPDDRAAPFEPTMWRSTRHTVLPEELTAKDIGGQADLARRLQHPPLRHGRQSCYGSSNGAAASLVHMAVKIAALSDP
jgi:hypothetical protein